MYFECKNCKHRKKPASPLKIKIIGILVAVFGILAWKSYLFAGTGYAFLICLAIFACGVWLTFASKSFARDLNFSSECPDCGEREWELKRDDEQKPAP